MATEPTDKARIVTVGRARYLDDGTPVVEFWTMAGGRYGYRVPVTGPDDPAFGGWTFRELWAIANGEGGVDAVREDWPPAAADMAAYNLAGPSLHDPDGGRRGD